SVPTGIFMYVERYIMHDPFKLYINGTDMLAIMIVFLVGVVLACLGLISLYIANIHAEVVNRPLYIVRQRPVRRGMLEPSAMAIPAKRSGVLRQEPVEG